MTYRTMKGISKSGLQALSESVAKFRQYLRNEHNPFPEEHFLLGQLVEDKLIGNVEYVNEKYRIQDINLPSSTTHDGKLLDLLLQAGKDTGWTPIDNFTESLFLDWCDQIGMKSPKKDEDKIARVLTLREYYELYQSLYNQEQLLVPTNIDDLSNQKVLAIKSSNLRNLLDYSLAKVVLTRQVDDILIKGELDWLIENKEEKTITIVDLKTYGQKASKAGWAYQCVKYGYFEQADNYTELVKFNYPGYTVKFVFLVIDVTNTVFAHVVSDKELEIGRYGYTYVNGEYQNLGKDNNKNIGFEQKLDLYKWYIDNYGEDVDDWPDESPDILRLKNNVFYEGVL